LTARGGSVNYRPGIPRYLQIADDIRRELRGEGEQLASEHALCARYKVSRPTIRQALDVLVQEGRIYRHAGRGTFSTTVTGDPRMRVIGSLDDMMALAEENWFKLIARDVVRVPPNIAQALKLPPGSLGYRVVGVRHSENGPFQHVTAWIPEPVGRGIAHEDLSKSSLVAAIERHLGIEVKFLEQVVDAALAPRNVAELMQLRPRTPLLLFERTYIAANGEPVEHAVTYQTGRRYPYRVILSQADRRG
jgi:GntR family transcriptional regulator